MTHIFTQTEQKEIDLRKAGKKANYKIWYVAKKKIRLILELFKEKEELERLL